MVVDLFGGMGAGIVCLKRLGIAMSTVIHVEHDEVANAVYRYWHEEDEEVNHIFISSFEEFEQNLEKLMLQHGRKFFWC